MESPEGQSIRGAEQLSCPACDGSSLIATGPHAHGFAVQTDLGVYSQPEYSVLECETCGLLCRIPTLSVEELSTYYAEVDYRKWEAPAYFPTERAVIARLRQLPPGASLLDFGCSTGRLLAALVGQHRCHGFEIDERAANEAGAKGLTMLGPEFLDSTPSGTFDGIVLMDVFEHLPAPTRVLRRLSRLLKPGGSLVIGTGNGDAPACRLDPAQFWYFRNIEHLTMLTFRHASWLAGELGMRLEGWERVCHYDHSLRARVTQFLRHMAYWRFRRGSRVERVLMRHLPGLRKAEHWPMAPAFSASRDHVVAVFVSADRTQ